MRALLFPLALFAAAPAAAQNALSFGAEAATDEVRRGLSWSAGRPVASGDAFVARGPLEASARIVSTRGTPRHGGADVVADVVAGIATNGPVQLRATAIGHFFAGAANRMDYFELGGSATYSLGPVRIDAGAIYAPEQSAIGGSNLYLNAGISAGIPLTPFTLSAAIGRSSGETSDAVRAARLRPLGSYTDWRLGVEFVQSPFTLGVDYVGTDIDQRATASSPYADLRHSGDRLVARARISF